MVYTLECVSICVFLHKYEDILHSHALYGHQKLNFCFKEHGMEKLFTLICDVLFTLQQILTSYSYN